MTEKEIEDLSPRKFRALFNQVITRIKKDPLANFVKAVGFMNFVPSHAQQVILKIVFSQQLDDVIKKPVLLEITDAEGNFSTIPKHSMTEVEMYGYLTGRTYNPADALERIIKNINLICGRRSGKTVLVAIITLYRSITVNWKPFLHKTPFATALIMSHSTEFSKDVLQVIKLFIKESPILNKLLSEDRKQTATTLNLTMPFILPSGKHEDSRVEIKVGAASSVTTRGIAACVAVCDEIAFWATDEKMTETDEDILKAVRPALKQFGKYGLLFKLSSPRIMQGVLYEEHKRYQEGTLPKSYEVFKAPLWVMNQAIPPEELEEEFILKKDDFFIEYGAEFMESMSSFILPSTLDHAVSVGVPRFAPDGDKEVRYCASLDAAFKSDRFVFTLVAATEKRVKQFLCKSWEGTRKDPVKAMEVAEWISNATKDYPIDFIVADQYAFSPLKEIFQQFDLTLEEFTFTSTSKKKIYYNLKRLFHSGQIDILDIELQTKELKQLVVEQSPSGNVKISHPRGGSDDMADALAVACMLAVEGQGSGMFSFEEAVSVLNYGIETDKDGVAFSAPSVDMLTSSGHLPVDVFDNTAEFGIDPADGKMKRWEDFEGEKSEAEDDFAFDF